MNKGERSEGYAFLYLLIFNEISFADSKFNKTSDSIKVNSLAENNHKTYIKINGDKTLSIYNLKNELVDKFNLEEIITEKFLSELLQSIKDKTDVSFNSNFIKEKLKIKKLKAPSSIKSDFLISFSHKDITYNQLQGVSVKSYLGNIPAVLNASKATNLIYKVENFQGSIEEVNLIDNRTKILDRIDLIVKQGGVLKYLRCSNSVFEDNLRKVDSMMPQMLGQAILDRYLKKDSKFINLITDPVKIIHFTSLLKAAAFGMFPSKVWDGTHPVKGIISVLEKGDLVFYHFLNEEYLNKYLFENAYFETASTSKHKFGDLYKEDGNLYIKLNCNLRV